MFNIEIPIKFTWDLGGKSVFLKIIQQTRTNKFFTCQNEKTINIMEFRFRMKETSPFTFETEIDLCLLVK